MRTGQYYLNKGGPYAEFFPEVLAASEGRSYIDYALPPRADVDASTSARSPALIEEFGVTSFKIFMFYGEPRAARRARPTRARSS